MSDENSKPRVMCQEARDIVLVMLVFSILCPLTVFSTSISRECAVEFMVWLKTRESRQSEPVQFPAFPPQPFPLPPVESGP